MTSIHGVGERVGVATPTGNHISLTVVGVRQLIERRPPADTGGTSVGVLYAVRFRVENPGTDEVRIRGYSLSLETTSGDLVEADALVDLDALAPGELVEGWVVFEIVASDSPAALHYLSERGPPVVWSLRPC